MTSEQARPCRSTLAVPGSNRHMMEKSAGLGADEVFFDLEDAVAPGRRAEARRLVVEALNGTGPAGHVQAVRVNGCGTGEIVDDVVTVLTGAGRHVDRIIVPKVRTAADVIFADRLIGEVARGAGLSRQPGLEILIETAAAAASLGEIVAASPHLVSIVFGPGDYTADLGIGSSLDFGGDSPVLDWAASQVVNHAVAAGIAAVDGPRPDFHDRDGYLRACRRAAAMGFSGKWCIHPNQIPWCHEGMGPTADQVAEAGEIIAAYEKAASEGTGAIAIRGRLVDEASRKHAEKVLAAARRGDPAGSRP